MRIEDLPNKTMAEILSDSSLDAHRVFDLANLYSDNTKYNQILQNRELFARNGTVVKIVEMEPLEYIEKCNKGFNTTSEKNFSKLSLDSVMHYVEGMRNGNQKFPLPILVYNHVRRTFLQEGRHRAVAAYYIGFSTIPVCIIDIYNQNTLDMIDNKWQDSNPNRR